MDDRLKKFVQLVDAGSFTNASRKLHISQPALSVAVGKLERELGAPLLVHGVRPLTLTPAGHLAYDTGKEIMVKTNNLNLRLAELTERELSVSIGMIDSVAAALFSSMEGINALERNASVSFVVDNSRNLTTAVEKGELDLAFVAAQRQHNALLEAGPEMIEPLVVVSCPERISEMNQAVRAGSLPRFISYDQASTSYKLIADTLQQRGIAVDSVFYSTSPEVMLRLVLLDKGVAALPYLQVRDYLHAGSLVVVGEPGLLLDRHINVVKRHDTILPLALIDVTRRVANLLGNIRTEAAAFLG